jgi:putative transposase
MDMLKAYKYELRPSVEQMSLFDKHFGVNRYVYNWALAKKIEYYTQTNKTLSQYELMKQLTIHKNEKEWIGEVTAQSLQQTIIHLETAYTAFFKKNVAFPKFKKKRTARKSYTVPQGIIVDFEKFEIQLPKMKHIKFNIDRKFIGIIKQATVSKTSTHRYFISILVENGDVLPEKKTPTIESTLGIDLGIKDFAITSDGEVFQNPRLLKSSQKRLAVYQRRFSRSLKGSKNREEARLKVARLNEKIANQRKDFQHKISTSLTRNDSQVSIIAMENLNVEGMLKNHKLAKHIQDVAWNQFTSFIKYKCDWYGKNFVQIGRFEPSSKTCSVCGHYHKELTLKVREWKCPICGTVHDRDHNASRNIKNFGFVTFEKLGVEDAAPRINKAQLNGSATAESVDVGKLLKKTFKGSRVNNTKLQTIA